MKINIGCGRDYRKGWLNSDISRAVKADVYFDIRGGKGSIIRDNNGNYRSQIKDEEADEIYISGVLEQIGDNAYLIEAMNEMHRVLKPGGIVTLIVPDAKYAIAHRDPMDIRKFTPETFQYFNIGTTEYELYGSVYGFAPWSVMSIEENARHILTVCLRK